PHLRRHLEIHRRPELGVLWKFETRRRHAEHFIFLSIECQLLADNGRISAVAFLPHLVAEHYDQLAPRLFVFGQKRATERRIDAQRWKEISGHYPAFQSHGRVSAREVDKSRNREGRGKLLEGRVLRAIIQIIERRHAGAAAAITDGAPGPDQAVRLCKRQGLY